MLDRHQIRASNYTNYWIKVVNHNHNWSSTQNGIRTESHRTKSHRTKSLRTKSHGTESHRTKSHNLKSGQNPTIYKVDKEIDLNCWMEQQTLSSAGLQASVNLDAGRGHPNGEPESHDTNRSGPDWSATSEANLTPVHQSADLLPRSVRIASLTASLTA